MNWNFDPFQLAPPLPVTMPALLERPKLSNAMARALHKHIMRERERKRQGEPSQLRGDALVLCSHRVSFLVFRIWVSDQCIFVITKFAASSAHLDFNYVMSYCMDMCSLSLYVCICAFVFNFFLFGSLLKVTNVTAIFQKFALLHV